MKISSVVIGLALVLSVTAFVLALWPAVADAPWEQAPVTFEEAQAMQVSIEPTQGEICLKLIDAIAIAGDGTFFLTGIGGTIDKTSPWIVAGCSDYFAQFGK